MEKLFEMLSDLKFLTAPRASLHMNDPDLCRVVQYHLREELATMKAFHSLRPSLPLNI
jgi:hypothetical protein